MPRLRRNRAGHRPDAFKTINDLLPRHFVTATVHGVKKSLSSVHASAEELHLLTNSHWGNTASDCGVIAPVATDLLISFVLDRRGFDGHLRTEALVTHWELLRPEDGDVRFWSWAKVNESLKQTERSLGNQWTAVFTEAAIGPGCPVWIAGEDFIVSGGAQEANDTELDNKLIDDFLSVLFGDYTGGQVTFEVDIEERGEAAEGHCGAILRLHGCKVTEVSPLDCF